MKGMKSVKAPTAIKELVSRLCVMDESPGFEFKRVSK